MSKKSYTPATCTFNQLLQIRRDSFDVNDFSILTDTHVVCLAEQPLGHAQTQHIRIPRAVFNKLIRWYLRPQKQVRRS